MQVRDVEALVRDKGNIAPEAFLEHYEQAALHRRVLRQVLVESRYLSITRRRIPQRFFCINSGRHFVKGTMLLTRQEQRRR
jgi:hypothetical protein